MSIISEQVRELRYKADIYNTVGSAWELNRAEAKILQRLLRKAADTIEALSKKLATNGGWIPCSERLPEESGYYLVTYHEWSNGEFLPKFDDTYVRRLHYQKSEQFTGWNFPKCVDKRAENDMNKEVIAWQPLPEEYHE